MNYLRAVINTWNFNWKTAPSMLSIRQHHLVSNQDNIDKDPKQTKANYGKLSNGLLKNLGFDK